MYGNNPETLYWCEQYLKENDNNFFKGEIHSNSWNLTLVNILQFPLILWVLGQLPPVRVGVWVKVKVGFRVEGQPDNCPGGKLPPG